ncbi:hypothetical protein R69658_02545 [Paraburkholderia aspalathi]|uniref:Uncharacterized protein n=1 Tax=Paraburkholderia aspalathi TaxID=1324617 RepID=A0ABN7LF92_9BURK|nr:hypothetical protein R69658_02545 [Paraburkholderia aspalathi]
MAIDLKDPTGLRKLARLIDEQGAQKAASVLVSMGDHEWLNDDRDWFEAHTARSYRIRKPYADEPAVEGATWVLVKQIEPGARSRIPARADGTDAFLDIHRQSEQGARDAWCDIILALIWQGFVERRTQSWGAVFAQADFLHDWAPATHQ